jgi:hypothetical protein
MRTFGEPTYNSDLDQWQGNIINTPDHNDDEYEMVASELNERLQDKAIPFPWVIAKFYDFLYTGKDIEVHPNRVCGQLYDMIAVVTWQDLIDMQIVTETDVFKYLDSLDLKNII